MAKEEVLAHIASAKKAHESNMQKALFMVESISYKGGPVPVGHTECDFGKWLSEDQDVLAKILGALKYAEIERLHREWHEEYAKIYAIYQNKEQKPGLLSRLFSGSAAISEKDHERAKASCADLRKITDMLLKQMIAIEKRVRSMPSGCC